MTRQIKVFATYITASYWYPEYANNHNSARQHHMKYTNTKSQHRRERELAKRLCKALTSTSYQKMHIKATVIHPLLLVS